MEPIQVKKEELEGIKKLVNSILGKSARGLFYSAGQIMGNNIAKEAMDPDEGKFFKNAGDLITKRSMAESIIFEGDIITVKGCVEVLKGREVADDSNKCHILRGVIVALYEAHQNKKMYCEEIECQSIGAEKCVFKIEKDVF